MSVITHRRPGQQGYVMMALLLAVTLILIALSAGLPSITAELRRRREEELIHRGVQYSRAIKKYYRRFGSYPATLEQLESSSHVRFLRKRYKDPMTDSEFRLLHVGEVQLTFTPRTGTPGTPLNQTGVGGSSSSASKSGQSGPSSRPFVPLSAMGATGPTFGGGPIMGVASTSDTQAFRVFNDKDHYNDWLFVYSPRLDRGGLLTHPFDGAWDFEGGAGLPAPPQLQSSPLLNTPGTIRPLR